jgi:hypothetical protein
MKRRDDYATASKQRELKFKLLHDKPEKSASKAYALLREALKRSKKVTIGNYMLSKWRRPGSPKVA